MRCAVPLVSLSLALFAADAAAQAVVGGIIDTTSAPVVVDQAAHRAYVVMRDGSLAVLEGQTIVARHPFSLNPLSMVIDSAHHRIHAALSRDQAKFIDAASGQLITSVSGAGSLLAVNERTETVYGIDAFVGSDVRVIDGATGAMRGSIALPAVACAMALDADANQLYVVHCNDRKPGASVVDLATSAVTFVPIPEHMPFAVAVNPTTHRGYVVESDGGTTVTVIDGITRQFRYLRTSASPSLATSRIAVNAAANRVYAVIGPQLVVIDGASETEVARVQLDDIAFALTPDPAMNRLYALIGTKTLLTLDGSTGAVVSRVPLPMREIAMDLDVATRRLYTAGNGGLAFDTAAAPGPPMNNYQGLWWSPAESGWGVNVAQQGDVWFAAWYTYDADGNPAWFVMPRGMRTGGEAFSGPLYRVTAGSSFQSDPFDSSSVAPTQVGTLSFAFSDAANGTMVANVNGVRVSKAITRQQLAATPLACETSTSAIAQNTTDLWWKAPAASESGWGLFLTEQGDTLFGVWFTYANGQPTWFVSTMKRDFSQGERGYKGDVYRTSGPAFSASSFDASRVRAVAVGTMNVRFTDFDQAVFTFTIGGVSGQKSITRERFAVLASACR